MYANIPVRSDSEVWLEGTDAEYQGRDVYETEMLKGITRTTESEEVILKDPNLDPANYNAKVTVKKKTVETGDYTLQKFTGAWTACCKEEVRFLQQVVNDNEAQSPNLSVEKLINFLHHGK